ncbi:MAG: permease, partial [Gammaproteobacteria bacterium]|nr:permease [Gammaproteobacteria bacterium]
MFEALANWIVYDLAGWQGTPLGSALQFFVMDVSKILVLLTLVIYVMGLLRALLAPEKVREFIRRRSNVSARFMAVGLGAVTPFCSCSSIPLFIGFLEAGIPLGVTLSFLIASPMINEVAVVVLASVIGVKMTATYVATGLTVAFVGGFVLERFRLERWVEEYVWKIHVGEVTRIEENGSLKARHAYALSQVREIVGRIWKFVLIGVGVGALIHGYVPEDFVARIAGDGSILSVIGAVAVGV